MKFINAVVIGTLDETGWTRPDQQGVPGQLEHLGRVIA